MVVRLVSAKVECVRVGRAVMGGVECAGQEAAVMDVSLLVAVCGRERAEEGGQRGTASGK